MASKIKQSEKVDIDARFMLANERTLLAWLRTALALIAGGLALTQIGEQSAAKNVAGLVVIVVGGLAAGVGYSRFKSADRAIRENREPDIGQGLIISTMVVIIIAVALVITHIFGIW